MFLQNKMLNFINKKLKVKKLKKVKNSFIRTIELLSKSAQSTYALKTPKEISAILNETMEKINEDNFEHKLKEISILFAPTGDIQLISIENGWGNEFLGLSMLLSKLMEKL